MADRKVGPYIISCSNEEAIFFPKVHITKGDLIDYYERIAPYMLPYVKNRLMTLHRFPSGIDHDGFYQKNTPDYFSKFIKRKKVKKQTDGMVNYLVCNNAATLVYITNQGTITPHVTLSKLDKLDYPDRMIFDFDPSNAKAFDTVKDAAFAMRELLENYGLISLVMTTGSRGLHVIVPIKRQYPFDIVRQIAKNLAQELADKNPRVLTLEVSKIKRRGKIFIDYLRNGYGATAVAPYAVRALPSAPVATPISWQELEELNSSQYYTIKTVFKRLQGKKNPWKTFYTCAQSLKKLIYNLKV